MNNKIRFLFKKLFFILSAFWKRKFKKQKLIKQIQTYNDSNLALLLNSFAFIDSVNKARDKEIEGNIGE